MRIFSLLIITASLSFACRESPKAEEPVQQKPLQYQSKPSAETGNDIETKYIPQNADQTNDEEKAQEAGCQYPDGTHSATVNYLNPRTNHTAQYELQVHVENCKVIQIDFPNGGWLDEDHIPATPINKAGDAALQDDKGRHWKIHLN